MVSLAQQIDEVERELAYRSQVYPRLYAKGTLQKSKGEFFELRMRAVLQTLNWLKTNEAEIREIMAQRFAERDRKRLEAETDDDGGVVV